MSTQEHANAFAELLETTDIPQGRSRLVRLSKDFPANEDFNLDQHRKYIVSACCMGVASLQHIDLTKVKTSIVPSADKYKIDPAYLEFDDQSLYIPSVVSSHMGMNERGELNKDYSRQVLEWIIDNINTSENTCELDIEERASENLDIEHLNDEFELTFKEIAALVRAIPNAYFT